jgi:hypothetical protein
MLKVVDGRKKAQMAQRREFCELCAFFRLLVKIREIRVFLRELRCFEGSLH